jgi:hypothetical protein
MSQQKQNTNHVLTESVSMVGKWKRTFNKFLLHNPGLTEEQVLPLFQRFEKISNALTPDHPSVQSFILSHDGRFGGESFDPKNLKNIEAYTFTSLMALIYEFRPLMEISLDEQSKLTSIKLKTKIPGNLPIKQKAELSLNMWKNPSNAVLSLPEHQVVIHLVNNQYEAQDYGWYLRYTNDKEGFPSNAWCITEPGTSGSNRWRNYRTGYGGSLNHTFYFGIDTTKTGNSRNFHLFSILVKSGEPNHYHLTDLRNNNDNDIRWDELVLKLPFLENYQHIFQKKPYNEIEVPFMDKQMDPLALIDEINGSSTEFARQPRHVKYHYITTTVNGQNRHSLRVLRKKRSWDYMDDELKNKYITSIEDRVDLIQRFSSKELLDAVRLEPKHARQLIYRIDGILTQEGRDTSKSSLLGLPGLGIFYLELQKQTAKFIRYSIGKKNIALFQNHNSPNFFGILDVSNGVNYVDPQTKIDYGFRFYDPDKIKTYPVRATNSLYRVQTFIDSKTGDSFTVVVDRQRPEYMRIHGYFFTDKTWKSIESRFVDETITHEELTKLSDMGVERSVDYKFDPDTGEKKRVENKRKTPETIDQENDEN